MNPSVQRAQRLWSRLTPLTLFAVLFLLGFFIRAAAVIATHQYLDLARYELERIAISLATTGVFGNPYSLPTGPSAHVSPGYPLFLAALFRIFGTGIPAEMVKQGVACAVTAFQYAILPAMARALGFDFRAGLLAGLIGEIAPLKLETQTIGDWDSSIVAVFLMLVAVLTVRVWKQQDFSFRHAAMAGLVWGVAFLFGAALLPLFFVLLAAGFFWVRGPQRVNYLRFCLIETLVAAACLSPWIIRNDSALGSPIVTRSNLGIELRMSNNPIASANEHTNLVNGVYEAFHPLQNSSEALKVRAMGEVNYNAQAKQEAMTWIRSHPARFAGLTVERIFLFWSNFDGAHLSKSLLLFLTRPLGILGLLYAFRKDQITGAALGLILLVFPLPNYVIQVAVRYSYPIDGILLLTSAVAMVCLWDAWIASRDKTGLHRAKTA